MANNKRGVYIRGQARIQAVYSALETIGNLWWGSAYFETGELYCNKRKLFLFLSTKIKLVELISLCTSISWLWKL